LLFTLNNNPCNTSQTESHQPSNPPQPAIFAPDNVSLNNQSHLDKKDAAIKRLQRRSMMTQETNNYGPNQTATSTATKIPTPTKQPPDTDKTNSSLSQIFIQWQAYLNQCLAQAEQYADRLAATSLQ